jgi:hypothetical protein
MYSADNLTTSMCPVLTNNGNLNLQKPKGPVQACKGVAIYSVGEEYKTARYTTCCGIPEENGKLMDCIVANSIEKL